jgi:hypothetical protein
MDSKGIAMVSKFTALMIFAIVCIGVQAQDTGFDAGKRLMQRQQQIQDHAGASRQRELERELQREQQRDRRIQQARQERELQQLRRQVAAAREPQSVTRGPQAR